jgi:hypothetical protein
MDLSPLLFSFVIPNLLWNLFDIFHLTYYNFISRNLTWVHRNTLSTLLYLHLSLRFLHIWSIVIVSVLFYCSCLLTVLSIVHWFWLVDLSLILVHIIMLPYMYGNFVSNNYAVNFLIKWWYFYIINITKLLWVIVKVTWK